MLKNTVITIGREFGSGGKEIGQKVAQMLQIPFYDKEILEIAAKENGVSAKVLADYDEKASSSLLYSLSIGAYTMGGGVSAVAGMPMNDKVFLYQSDTIRKIAASPCVIVGRCSDYVLREHPNCVNVFIRADMESRVKRICERYSVDRAEAESMIAKTDKKRANYYNHYSNQRWGLAQNYQLCLESSAIGTELAAKLIVEFAELAEAAKKAE